jgi:hypothetical protein
MGSRAYPPASTRYRRALERSSPSLGRRRGTNGYMTEDIDHSTRGARFRRPLALAATCVAGAILIRIVDLLDGGMRLDFFAVALILVGVALATYSTLRARGFRRHAAQLAEAQRKLRETEAKFTRAGRSMSPRPPGEGRASRSFSPRSITSRTTSGPSSPRLRLGGTRRRSSSSRTRRRFGSSSRGSSSATDTRS